MKSSILKYFLFTLILLLNVFPQDKDEEPKNSNSNDVSRLYQIFNKTKLLNQFQVMNYREILEIATMVDQRIVVVLLDYLGSARPVVQQQILLKLADFKIPATAQKISLIAKNADKWWVRSVAIEALIYLKEPYVFPSLFALDDPQKFVQDMAINGLNQLISKDDISYDENTQKDRDFWKKNQVTILEKYKDVKFPEQKLFYYDPVYQFRIKKLEDVWECSGQVMEKNQNVRYIFRWLEKDYDIWVWGEKDERVNKNDYDTELEKIKNMKKENLKEFKSSAWKPYKKFPWTAYEMRYYGKYESDILYFHSLIVVFTNNNIYFLETADSVKTKDEALTYFFDVVSSFEIIK